ncbi:MAG: acyl-CoA dehydrogenase [Bacteroidetes bacterium]|nr:acyl-CoA dehydrogenase [Bacteroidota bacterium]MCL5738942.1 acyl-CoA dehydrogenase [Bacteroidota bacterium]
MDFKLTPENEQVRELARSFAQTEIKPVVMKYDEAQEFPFEVIRKLGELGFMGVTFPEKYGGAGLTYVDYCSIVEEISRVDPSVGLSVAAHNGLCTSHIYNFAGEELKLKYLPDLASGRKVGAWGLTEPASGSDSGAMRTAAVRDGDHYILNGTKQFTTHGSVGETIVVMALTDPSKRKKGISAFILEKGTPGFSVGKKENKLGMRASDTSTMIFQDVRVPKDNLIGAEGEGFKQALQILDAGRIGIAALAVGVAQGALDASVKYARERVQFGKPIAEFQAIQWKISEMATKTNAARMLTYKAAYLKDHGKDITLAAATAKYFASEAAVKCTEEAIQIHGGYGFIKDFPVEKFYRDVKLLTIGEGTSEVQKMVIARKILDI